MKARPIYIDNSEDTRKELFQINVDGRALDILTQKLTSIIIRIDALSSPQCNILKQTAISCGADAAIPKWAVIGRKKRGSALLFGNIHQLKNITQKLSEQPFGLKKLGKNLGEILSSIQHSQPRMYLKRHSLNFSRTLICGVLNVTPDSFSDGGLYFEPKRAIERAHQLVDEGADLIDIGGESTRPGAEPVSEKEELRRVMPVIEKLDIPIPISIDTYKSGVAKEALDAGCELVNDISGLSFDSNMINVVRERDAGCVIMHIKGSPRDMQRNPEYKDVIGEIISYLADRIELATTSGIPKERIMIDPGIGFGKRNPDDNLLILKRLREFQWLSRPIIIGVSRKSFIGKVLGLEVLDRLSGSIAASVIAVINGANCLRTHDVKETREAVRVAEAIKGRSNLLVANQ
jgi:dihydropteroate synthase